MAGEGWRKGGNLAWWPPYKQGTWIRRRMVDFQYGDIGVADPTTYDLYWDRA
jgi:hypothetical protein